MRFDSNQTSIKFLLLVPRYRHNCIFRLLKTVYYMASVFSYRHYAWFFSIVHIVVVKCWRLSCTSKDYFLSYLLSWVYYTMFLCVCVTVLTCYRGRTVDHSRHRMACLSPRVPGGHRNSPRRRACTIPATAPDCRATQTQRWRQDPTVSRRPLVICIRWGTTVRRTCLPMSTADRPFLTTNDTSI